MPNDEGEAWSVEPEIFNRTYQTSATTGAAGSAGSGRNGRHKTHLVIILEGPVTAKPGDR